MAAQDELREFFISEDNDPALTNNKLEGYINKIKDNYFFAGNIEIYILLLNYLL